MVFSWLVQHPLSHPHPHPERNAHGHNAVTRAVRTKLPEAQTARGGKESLRSRLLSHSVHLSSFEGTFYRLKKGEQIRLRERERRKREKEVPEVKSYTLSWCSHGWSLKGSLQLQLQFSFLSHLLFQWPKSLIHWREQTVLVSLTVHSLRLICLHWLILAHDGECFIVIYGTHIPIYTTYLRKESPMALFHQMHENETSCKWHWSMSTLWTREGKKRQVCKRKDKLASGPKNTQIPPYHIHESRCTFTLSLCAYEWEIWLSGHSRSHLNNLILKFPLWLSKKCTKKQSRERERDKVLFCYMSESVQKCTRCALARGAIIYSTLSLSLSLSLSLADQEDRDRKRDFGQFIYDGKGILCTPCLSSILSLSLSIC